MKKLASAVSILLVALLSLGMFSILPVYAATEIRLDPSDNIFSTDNTSPGYRFNVTAWVYDVADLFAHQVYLTVDDSMLNITGAWLPTWDPEYVLYGQGSVQPAPAFYDVDVDGYYEAVKIGDSLLMGTTFTGNGKLAIIELEIISAPDKYETLSCDLAINSSDTYVLDSNNDEIPCTKYNGYYEYSWSPPATHPYLAVSPDTLSFDMYTSWNGTYFNVEVYLMQIDTGWALHNATFDLSYNSTLTATEAANITIDSAWTTYNVIVDPGAGNIHIFVGDYVPFPPSGDVLVATIKFQIIGQGAAPPRPPGSYDVSDLVFSNIELWDTAGTITPDPSVNGQVTVYCLVSLPLPWLEVVPKDTVMGPDLVVGDQFGKTFQVKVDIKGLHEAWYLVGIQFRLSYDKSLMEVVSIEEGDYLQQFNNTPTPPYTYFIAYDQPDDPLYGCHVLVGDLLLPNGTGQWNVFPGGDFLPGEPIPPEANGTVATITFRPLVQSWTETYTSEFNLIEIVLVDKDVKDIIYDTPQNGTYTMLPISADGRRIDAWFVDYPSPYGGQGLMEPADLVVPQQLICLTAKVTYNWWPVAQKQVKFHVYDNQGNLIANLQNVTGDDGHAYVCFRMPWPSVDPESLFGVWTINATVSVADVTIFDVITFHYDWLVRIWKVTTDKEEYMHLETVTITVEYGTHAQQLHDVQMTAMIQDELLVPIGMVTLDTTIGGAVYCEYKNYSSSVTITIPYWAYAGKATIRIHFLDMPGGVAVTPEATKEIWILPL